MNDRPLRFDRRMTAAEALMWNIEKDPSLRSTFMNVTLLDRPPDFAGFRHRIARAVTEIPRLRQRVVPPPARLAPPVWVDDPSFDLDFHIRRVAVAAPGTDRELLELAARDFEDPFDRARPLWQFTIVEGLTDGRAALLAKMHHTITDGVGAIRLSAMFLDLSRDAIAPEEPSTDPADRPFADRPEGIVASALGAVAHTVRSQTSFVRDVAGAAVGTALHPGRIPRAVADSAGVAQSLVRQILVTDPARSPLWTGRRSLRRSFEVLSVDLERLKAATKRLGGTVNDGFVTAVAGAAAAYHREKGAEVDELRMSMAINTREDRSAGGNAFAPARVLVPAGIKDPEERFRAIHDRMGGAKQERALGVADALAGFLNALPTAIVVNFARQQVETVDFATSNLRGAPFDLYIAGAEVLSNHPMGPTGGTAFNATVLSYRGQLDVGLNIDAAAIDDPGLLRDLIAESFDELLAFA